MLRTLLLSATLLGGGMQVARADIDDGVADNDGQRPLPTGQYITPSFATGSTFTTLDPHLSDYPNFRPMGVNASALSPDGKTLLVLTDGYNTLDNAQAKLAADANAEYVFVYDVSNPRAPVQKQILRPANTFVGVTWAPDGSKFYVSGGNDDVVYVYAGAPGSYAVANTIQLGHNGNGIGLFQYPQAGGIAVSADGGTVVVANTLNESITVIDSTSGAVRYEYDLRPFNTSGQNGVAGGEYVYSVAIKGNATVYATSLRDREVVAVDISGAAPKLVSRIKLPGSPNNLVLNKAQTTLYVAQDNSDTVAVIDTATNAVKEEIDAIAPTGLLAGRGRDRYTGAGTNNLALSPDEKTLYVTNGGQNALAIIPLDGAGAHRPDALVPTGWYPTTVSVSADGKTLWVFNFKSDGGANPRHLTSSTSRLTETTYPGGNKNALIASYASNQYVDQLEQSGMLTLPVPSADDYVSLSLQVAANNGYLVPSSYRDARTMKFLHDHIKHVIYIVKENRTFDQVLGDVDYRANGDPSLTVFGYKVTPNFHLLARNFVTLDNFFCTGEVSGNGWPWSTAGRETDWTTKNIPMDYAFDVTRYNAPYDAEGQNSNVDVGYNGVGARTAELPSYPSLTSTLPGGTANVLPGTADVGYPDGKNGQVQGGAIWDAALRAGLTIRDYGFMSDNNRYGLPASSPDYVPLLRNPGAASPPVQVQFPTKPALLKAGNFDPYFRGFDNAFPDEYRFEEFQREFKKFDANNSLPNLILLRYMHDHMGSFGSAIAGINTPELQQADNDLAVGLTVQMLSRSQHYAKNTLVFINEDDAQDGPDHVDAHRSTAYVVGPYVKQATPARVHVISERYSTVNMLRTIEDILGLEHLNLNTAYQRPMTAVFDIRQAPEWSFRAESSTLLRPTGLPLEAAVRNGTVRYAAGGDIKPTHDGAWWADKTRGFDWSAEDRVPADLFNRVLWEGLMPGKPYPTARGGADLRAAAAMTRAQAVAALAAR